MAYLAISIVLILQQYTNHIISDYDFEFSWFAVSLKIFTKYLIWLLMFPVLIRIVRNFLLKRKNLRQYTVHLLLGIVLAALHQVLSLKLYDYSYYFKSGFIGGFFNERNQLLLSAGIFSSFIEYCIIIVVILALAYYNQYLIEQKALNEAKLNALRMQLHPHFLFNTLNSITSLIDIWPKKAQKMLSKLGFLMRELLEYDDQAFIPLEKEIEYIKTYLSIEETRFSELLTVHYKVDNALNKVLVPALILQPIVENAIKHGISKCPNGGELTISTRCINDEQIELNVVNDYSQVYGNHINGFGIGTNNVRKRLEQLYGTNFCYEIKVSDGKYGSCILIPLMLEND